MANANGLISITFFANTVIVGKDNEARHPNVILIGENLRSDHQFQVKIGINGKWSSHRFTKEEFNQIRQYFPAQ